MVRQPRVAGYVIAPLLGLAVMLVVAPRIGWPVWMIWSTAALAALLLFNAGAALVLRRARKNPPTPEPGEPR